MIPKKIVPKKKKDNTKGNEPENQAKPLQKTQPVAESKKQQPKQEKQEPKVIPQAPLLAPADRLDQIIAQQAIQNNSSEQKGQKISIEESSRLSEQERLKLRKLRFGVLGTEAPLEEIERLKQERLKKFGGTTLEDAREALEKRKQKFANGPAVVGEDPQVAKKRLQKFGGGGNSGVSITPEDKQILQERKKKFGNPQTTLSLDEQINKTKPIKKFHPKHNNHKKFNNHHHDNKFRR